MCGDADVRIVDVLVVDVRPVELKKTTITCNGLAMRLNPYTVHCNVGRTVHCNVAALRGHPYLVMVWQCG